MKTYVFNVFSRGRTPQPLAPQQDDGAVMRDASPPMQQQRMTEPTKICTRCKRDLPWSAYNLRKTEQYTLNGASCHKRGKPEAHCKACDTIYARERRARLRQARETRRYLDAQTRRNATGAQTPDCS
jgi:hypothetical protein